MSISTNTSDRQHFVDVLRGFALFGILMVNLSFFSSVYDGSGVADPMLHSDFEKGLSFLISTLFDSKFYLLFSFLFGYSFYVQMRSSEAKLSNFKAIFFRRLCGLLLIGVLHAVLWTRGDILIYYVMFAVILFSFRQNSDRVLLKFSLSLLLLVAVLWSFLAWLIGLFTDPDLPLDDLIERRLELELIQQKYLGGWSDIIAQHVAEFSDIWVSGLIAFGPVILAMFCIGLIAGRRQLFLNLEQIQPYFTRVLFCGVLIGLPAAMVYGYFITFEKGLSQFFYVWALTIVAAPLLSAVYMLCLLKLYQRQRMKKVMALLASAGQMSLSNYIAQSIICTYLFFGVGFGWMGHVTPSQKVLIAVSIFILQCFYSQLWLRYFAYGPLEWLLRCFTYLKVLPLGKSKL